MRQEDTTSIAPMLLTFLAGVAVGAVVVAIAAKTASCWSRAMSVTKPKKPKAIPLKTRPRKLLRKQMPLRQSPSAAAARR